MPWSMAPAQEETQRRVSEMLRNMIEHIRAEVGPIAQLARLVSTNKLPKSRSGKTLRSSIRAIVENAANEIKGEYST